MGDTIASLGPAADSTYGESGRQSKQAAEADKAAADSEATDREDPADLRLIIEDDRQDGVLIYKTFDRCTGKLVQAWGRDQLLKMREASGYVAGQVIKTRA
jgi:hypothetical protein